MVLSRSRQIHLFWGLLLELTASLVIIHGQTISELLAKLIYIEQNSGIDNYYRGYLGMAVQFYVQAHLGHYHILTQKEYSQN